MAQYKYDIAKVLIKDIKIKPESDDALRYKLVIPMRNVKKELLTVIMLNPSYADKTVNIVIKHGWYNKLWRNSNT